MRTIDVLKYEIELVILVKNLFYLTLQVSLRLNVD